jgi:ATP synthase protein I|tara:strand:- start:76 stop:492 length:417 start_codon:yes stop_codon:yes gene_type:complete
LIDKKQNVNKKKGLFPPYVKSMLIKISTISVISALIVSGFFGLHAGISVLCGTFVVIVGLIVSTPIANRSWGTNKASSIVTDALKAEGIKILIIILLLWAIFNFYEDKVPLAIIFGLAIAAIFSGIGLTKLDTKIKGI